MEVMKWNDVIEEPESEETQASLRPRMPRHHSEPDSQTVTPSMEDIHAVKSSHTSSDESHSSDDGEDTINVKPSNGVSHGDGNGVSDAKSTNGHSNLDERYEDFLVSEEVWVDPELNSEQSVIQKSDGLSAKQETVVEIEEHGNDLPIPSTLPSTSNESVKYMEAELRKTIEAEYRELYLEKLSHLPGKHEFYCPKCNACITKVLVREEAKPEAIADPQPVRVQSQNWFRCTSCFSFLVPIGNWLFPNWKIKEDEDETEPFRGSSEPTGETQEERKTEQPQGLKEDILSRTLPRHEDHTIVAPSRESPDPTALPSVTSVTTTIETQDHGSERVTTVVGSAQSQPWASARFVKKIQGAMKGRIPVAEEESGVTVPSVTKPLLNDKVETLEKEKVRGDQLPVGTVVSAAVMAPVGSDLETLRVEVSIPPKDSKLALPEKAIPVFDPSVGDTVIVRTKPSELGDGTLLQEVIIQREPELDTGLPGAVIPDTTPAVVPLQQDSPKSLEIVKSIVYGGLVESITSLGIVTSAASGGATTLNIVVLALANLIGGLFLIVHNVWELRDDQSTVQSSRTNQLVEKYREVLGRRENFLLHATFVILSFVLFGLVPPVIYGLSFRVSDDKDLKLAAVGIASLVCILILAVGKAYIQRPNKYIKTIIYYLVIGFAVSGASYLAGVLIKKLLEKISSSDSTQALAMPITETFMSNRAWGYY